MARPKDSKLGLSRQFSPRHLTKTTHSSILKTAWWFKHPLLASGKLAEIVALSKDILTVPEEEIGQTQVVYTIIGGKVLYER